MSGKKLWRDKETLEYLYNEKGMTTCEVGDRLDCTGACISKWLKKHSIERRAPREYFVGNYSKKANFQTDVNGYERWNAANGNDVPDSMYVHRLLAIAMHGIEAVKDMDIHHKNGIKWDNRPENIEVKTKTDHMSEHAIERGFGIEIQPDNNENQYTVNE